MLVVAGANGAEVFRISATGAAGCMVAKTLWTAFICVSDVDGSELIKRGEQQ